jgi:hypothetical protein
MRESVGWSFFVAAALTASALLSGCGGHGSSSGGGGASSTAPASNAQGSTNVGLSGTWLVTGTDPQYGSFSGTAVMAVSTQGFYTAQRLVTFSQKLPDGRSLMQAWNTTAVVGTSGLTVQAALRQADFLQRVGSLTRTAADAKPLILQATFAQSTGGVPATGTSGTAITGTFMGAGVRGPTETWTLSTDPAPTFPETDVTHNPINPVQSGIRGILFALLASYHGLPDIAPYTSRTEFQAGVHYTPTDHTAKNFYRAMGPTAVVILDKVTDPISILEETQRANAFSMLLYEKAASYQADLQSLLVDRSGMISAVNTATGARSVSGDGALHQGVWVASQVFRYQVTGDPDAFANVVSGTKALVTLVDISPDKTQFARAIQSATPATCPSGWNMGTGPYSGLAWLPGGNNDMLHGIELGFMAAESILPSGHPLRAEIATQAVSLVNNVSIAQSGTHQIFCSYVAWKTTGSATLQAQYMAALGSGANFVQKGWIALGDGLIEVQGIADWSGQHLAQCDLLAFSMLGGTSPNYAELSWRKAAVECATAGFLDIGCCRLGLLSMIAGASNVPGATDAGKDILEEIPYPKFIGDADCDLRIAPEFCMSPYPSDPWKLDWMTNTGREQALEGRAYFQRGNCDNFWNTGELQFLWGPNANLQPGQEYLCAYWFGRLTGQIGPMD